jgi:ElaB/YqjD/DUF883 family membrane-anchored ribosome-binding protein
MGETAEALRHDIETTREQMGGTLEAIGDRVSPGRIVARRRNRVVVWCRDVRDRVMGATDDARSSMSDRAREFGNAPETMVEGTKDRVQGSPLVAGAIAFGVGVLAGSVFPATRTERQVGRKAMEAAEPLKGELQEAGRDVAEHLREPLKEAVADVKDTATQGAQSVRDTAREGAEEVRRSAQ